MLKIIEQFATAHHIRFSTDSEPKKSKIKAMFITETRVNSVKTSVNLTFFEEKLLWVPRSQHLGHTLSCDEKMGGDCLHLT